MHSSGRNETIGTAYRDHDLVVFLEGASVALTIGAREIKESRAFKLAPQPQNGPPEKVARSIPARHYTSSRRSSRPPLGPGIPPPMQKDLEASQRERYDAYRNAPPSGRRNAARAPRSHWQETYAGPSLERPFPPLLFVFAPAPRRAAPGTREGAFCNRTRHVGGVNYQITVATTTLPLLTRHGADRPVWRAAGRGEDRYAFAALPKAR
ncbi:hypothetical protein [Streptomyces syringium]|uniref:hypothetical protein n=1 Tax=Streptomyces syringium TaxID=76729 RepID=UPI003427EE74